MARRNLTKPEIIEEAISLLEQDGIAGLTMRKLACRLNVRAPTLYYYIADKSALLSEVLSVLFERCLQRMPETATWQAWMREFGKAIWQVQQEQQFAPQLILAAQLDDEGIKRTIARIMEELAKFDRDTEQLFFIQSAVQAVITGWSIFAHTSYSDKVGRLVNFHDAAMSSIDALIQTWEPMIRPVDARQTISH